MTRIAVLDDYIGCAEEFADWTKLGDDIEVTFFREAIDPDQLVEVLADYDVIAITQQRTWFPREVLAALPKLRLIVTNGKTSTVIDHEARRELNVLLCGTGDTKPERQTPSQSSADAANYPGITLPAQMAWALIFALLKRTGTEDRTIRAGGWQTGFPIPMNGLTLGLAGLGNHGGMMVGPARAFGMNVIAWSENLTDARTDELGVQRVSKEELLRSSDVLGVFLVLSDRTRGLFQREDLALMKKTSYIVNISRGPIIDEVALVDALSSGQIAGAGLDVFDREPLPVDHPLRSMDNVVLTPHIGYVTEIGFRNSFVLMAENIAAFLRGSPIRVVE
jgi:phosphoglycerate dehydrogenase-like enzyme